MATLSILEHLYVIKQIGFRFLPVAIAKPDDPFPREDAEEALHDRHSHNSCVGRWDLRSKLPRWVKTGRTETHPSTSAWLPKAVVMVRSFRSTPDNGCYPSRPWTSGLCQERTHNRPPKLLRVRERLPTGCSPTMNSSSTGTRCKHFGAKHQMFDRGIFGKVMTDAAD